MKKSLLVSTLAVAFCAIVALAGTHKVKKIMVDNIQKSTTVKSLKSLSKAGEAADETPNLQVLLEEDSPNSPPEVKPLPTPPTWLTLQPDISPTR